MVQAVSEANAASSSVVAGGGAGEYRKLPAAELTSALARSNTDTGLTTAVHREGHHHHRGSNGSTMGSGDPEAGEMSHSRSSGALNGAVGGGGAGVSGAGGAGSSVKQPLLADLRSGAGDRDSRDDGAGRMHSVTAATKGVVGAGSCVRVRYIHGPQPLVMQLELHVYQDVHAAIGLASLPFARCMRSGSTRPSRHTLTLTSRVPSHHRPSVGTSHPCPQCSHHANPNPPSLFG